MLLLAAQASVAALWFDPASRYSIPSERCTVPPANRLCYIPGLDGTHASPFVQWPSLAEDGWTLRVQDVRASPVEESFDAAVEAVIAYLRSSTIPTVLMGESYGGVIAAAAALREPTLLEGLVLVNPATAYSHRPRLRADATILKSVPTALFPAACALILGRKSFDVDFLLGALRDVLFDRKLVKLRESDPSLAACYDAALRELTAQLVELPPKAFMVQRLHHLEAGCALLDAALPTMAVPVLVIAGTADALLDSEVEAARLQSVLGDERCSVQLVPGAGHAGTLDQRVDLAAVIAEWLGGVRNP